MAQQRGGGGFLAGAAQTAMGVAGGALLGNVIADASEEVMRRATLLGLRLTS